MKGLGPVAAIIQARMGSTRLPGKSLARVCGDYSLIELVLTRARNAGTVDIVVLATSEDDNCDPLAELAETIDGVHVFRGDEQDVLKRFAGAIEKYRPETVVRICADNPLISPDEIDRLVTFYLEGRYDYSANNTPECGLADGLGCEIVDSSVLLGIARKDLSASDREHVTEYILSHESEFRIGWLKAPRHLFFPRAKLDIDTDEDLERMRKFCAGLSVENAPLWTSVEITEHAKTFFA